MDKKLKTTVGILEENFDSLADLIAGSIGDSVEVLDIGIKIIMHPA